MATMITKLKPVAPRFSAARCRKSQANRTKNRLGERSRGIDLLLGGGLDCGSSTLIIGPAGAGKSSIALQYAAAAAERRENALVFSFEESLSTMFSDRKGSVLI